MSVTKTFAYGRLWFQKHLFFGFPWIFNHRKSGFFGWHVSFIRDVGEAFCHWVLFLEMHGMVKVGDFSLRNTNIKKQRWCQSTILFSSVRIWRMFATKYTFLLHRNLLMRCRIKSSTRILPSMSLTDSYVDMFAFIHIQDNSKVQNHNFHFNLLPNKAMRLHRKHVRMSMNLAESYVRRDVWPRENYLFVRSKL